MTEKNKRKVWSREETFGLLKCYLTRKGEFSHSRKKKFAYANILEDMICQGITNSSTTVTALEGKMRTLLVAYKTAKDNASKADASPCIAPYMDYMEEIFGDKPIISNNHTLHLGSTSSKSKEMVDEAMDEDKPLARFPLTNLVSCPPSSSSDYPTSSRKRKSAGDGYFEALLKVKKEAIAAKLAAKQADRQVKQAQRAEFIKRMAKSLEDKWKKEIELEHRKLSVLETLLSIKKEI